MMIQLGIELLIQLYTIQFVLHILVLMLSFSVASPYSSTVVENPESRIFYISSFPAPIGTEKSLPPFVGMERHKCAISPLDLDKLIYCALLAEGFPATEELNMV